MSIKANTIASPPSASTIELAATTGCHLLKLNGYSHARVLNRKHFMSTKFNAAGHTWRIIFYPTTGDMILLDLQLVGTSNDVTAEVQFSMLHRCSADEMPNPYRRRTMRRTFKNACCINMCGISWFVNAKEMVHMPLHKYIDKDDDSIVVRCDIKVMNKPAIHADSLEDLGLICHCKDDTCKRLHDTCPAMSAQPVVNKKWAFTRLFSCFLA